MSIYLLVCLLIMVYTCSNKIHDCQNLNGYEFKILNKYYCYPLLLCDSEFQLSSLDLFCNQFDGILNVHLAIYEHMAKT